MATVMLGSASVTALECYVRCKLSVVTQRWKWWIK